MSFYVPLSEEIENLIFLLNGAGFEAYAVGGCVRDSVLAQLKGSSVSFYDVDITTNARPDDMFKVFAQYKIIKTGIKHGTVTVLLPSGGSVEVTTYRSEGQYSDNRHPDKVVFKSDLIDDLSRRDFTINALCFHPSGELIDMFGGIDDLKDGKIRCIGDAKSRFSEDSLRILRALRFAATYGFKIEEKTKAAIHAQKNLLENISKERIYSELKRMLCSEHIYEVLMEFFDVFSLIVPELENMQGFDQHNFHHKYDIWQHTAVVVQNAPPNSTMRLSALFHDCGKVNTFGIDENGVGHFYAHAAVSATKAKTALLRLKADTKTINQVELLVKIHDSPIEESQKAIKKRLNKYGEETLRNLIDLQCADTKGLADEFQSRLPHFEHLQNILDQVLQQQKCFSLKSLEVDGNDVKNLGFQGREIGNILNCLLDAVIDEKVENKKSKLIEYLENYETK